MASFPTPAAAPDEAEREAAACLEALHGPLGLRAAILALLIPPGSTRGDHAWELETTGVAGAAAVRAHVGRLPLAARLPWFETLVSRMRGQPLAARQELLESTRRLMSADRIARPIDRLHWLAMRQRLGGAASHHAHVGASAELSLLPQAQVESIAGYTAFLSRLVPFESLDHDATAAAWYAAAMAPWQAHADVPECRPPGTDGLVQALHELQSLAWMQRPMLIRLWVSTALVHSRHGRLASSAADALRLSCSLLDSPLPPELARYYGTAAAPEAGP